MSETGQSTAIDFTPIRRPLAEARHLSGAIYTSPEIWALEKERLFTAEWLMVCREEELPNPGDYLTTRIMNEAVLVVRGRDGELAAMANACRHRGVEVATGSGNSPLFVCPYHAWTYELDGRLRGMPEFEPERRKALDCDLMRFPLKVWRGCVFVSLNKAPRDFATFIAPFEEQFGFMQLDKCRLARKVEFDMKCNWKLTLENLVDLYHAGVVHAASFGGHYKSNKADIEYTLLPNGGSSLFEDAAPLSSDGKRLSPKVPWLSDRSDGFACIGLLWPNFRLSGRSDYFRVWNIWPVAPDRTRMVANMLFPPEAFAEPDFEQKLDTYEAFLRGAIEEDRAMVESLQLGVASQNFEPGPLAKLEAAIQHFLIHYADRLSA